MKRDTTPDKIPIQKLMTERDFNHVAILTRLIDRACLRRKSSDSTGTG